MSTKSDFQFLGFEPGDSLRERANRALDELLENSPTGAVAAALLERDEYSYCCAIEIYSRKGPFTARGYNARPEVALANVTRSLSNKLRHGKEVRRISERESAIQLTP